LGCLAGTIWKYGLWRAEYPKSGTRGVFFVLTKLENMFYCSIKEHTHEKNYRA
jgi:hypothetical protein